MDYKPRKNSIPKKKTVGDVKHQSQKPINDQNSHREELKSVGKLETIDECCMIDEENSALLSERSLAGCRGDNLTQETSDIFVLMPPKDTDLLSPAMSNMSNMTIHSSRLHIPRPLEVELNSLLKKFATAKVDLNKNEKNLFTFAGQAQMLMDQIRKETGKEISVDNDLCEILSFAEAQNKDNDLAIDLAVYKDILNEIDGTWRNLIYDIFGCKKEPAKSSNERWEKRAGVPLPVQKTLANAQAAVYEKRRTFFQRLRMDALTLTEKMKAVLIQHDANLQLLHDKEENLNRLKFKEAEAIAASKRLEKTCEAFVEESALKNKEIESLKEELNEVDALNKELEEQLSRKENEYEESLASLRKANELASEEVKKIEKQYKDKCENLTFIEMREENLRNWPIERIPETKEIQEHLNKIRGKITLEERSAIETLVRIIEDLEGEINSKKQTESDVKERTEKLKAWDEELTMREDTIAEQINLLNVRKQLLEMVANRDELRREVARGTSDLLRLKSKEVKELLQHWRNTEAS